MSFSEAWLNYFSMVCDATWFLQLFFYSAILVVLDLPKRWDAKSIALTIAKFIGVYACYFLICGLFFAFDRMMGNLSQGLFFSCAPLLIIAAYIFILLHDEPLKKFIKFSFLAAGVVVTSQVGRNLGLVVGNATGDNFALVFLARSLPSLICVLIGYIMWRYEIKDMKNLPKLAIVIVGLLSYLLIAIALWENRVTNYFNDATLYSLFVCLYLVLLFILILAYYSLYYIVVSRQRLVESELRYSLSEAENEAIKINEAKMEEFSKSRHDLKNQLSYLSILLDEGKTEEAKKYLSELNSLNAQLSEVFVCSNKTISSIINLEMAKAKAAGVRLSTNVVVPPTLPFADLDLVSLISNLIDNAIENCDGSSDKGAMVSIFNYQDYLRISISNPIREEDREKAIKLSSKKGENHGYGTKIIREIASQYDGYASFDLEGELFVADVLLYLSPKKEGE
ncbi:MAG: GHKL domain-containing protein [Bacillota bacterium]|nr:GHKL domain-containing protein [Bacillota bacterium]